MVTTVIFSLLSIIIISVIGFYLIRQVSMLNAMYSGLLHRLEGKLEQLAMKNSRISDSGKTLIKQNEEILEKLEEIITEIKAGF